MAVWTHSRGYNTQRADALGICNCMAVTASSGAVDVDRDKKGEGMPQPNEQSFQGSLSEFIDDMERLLCGAAEGKGYSRGSADRGGRDLIDAVAMVAGESHPAGEIVYKVKRFLAKKQLEDAVKIAAWAFLMWDRERRTHKT